MSREEIIQKLTDRGVVVPERPDFPRPTAPRKGVLTTIPSRPRLDQGRMVSEDFVWSGEELTTIAREIQSIGHREEREELVTLGEAIEAAYDACDCLVELRARENNAGDDSLHLDVTLPAPDNAQERFESALADYEDRVSFNKAVEDKYAEEREVYSQQRAAWKRWDKFLEQVKEAQDVVANNQLLVELAALENLDG